MYKFRHTASLVALSAMLVVGACGKKDKGADANIPGVGKLTVKEANAKTMKKLLAVDDRKVSDAEADQALAQLGLADDKASGLSWDSKTGKAGDYHYTNLSFKSDDGEAVKVANLKLDGVHMKGETASFDKMTITGVSVTDEDASGTIDALTLSRPHPKLAARILDRLSDMDSLDDLDMDIDLDLEDGEAPFGAMLLEGLNMSGEDGQMKIKTFGFGSDETSGKGTFLAQDLSFSGTDDELGMPVSMSLKSASATDFDSKKFARLNDNMSRKNPSGLSPFKSGMGNFKLEDFKLSADTLNITAAGMAIQSTQKGSVNTAKQVMQPIRISFNGAPQTRDMQQAYEALSSLGYEALEFTGQATTTMDKSTGSLKIQGANFAMTDGFNLQYDLDGVLSQDDASDMSINQLKVQLTDHSFLNKAIGMAAKMQGTNPALLRMQAKGGLMFLSAMGKTEEEKKMLADVANAAGNFMDDGGTLVLELNPSRPISVNEIQRLSQNPNKAATELGLKISHHN